MDKKHYFDELGFLKGFHEDFGDGCHRIMMHLILQVWNGCPYTWNEETIFYSYKIAKKSLECENSPNKYRRHPDPDWWYSDCDRFSRDQAIALTIAMGTFKDKPSLKGFAKNHKFLMTNTMPNGVWKDPDEHAEKAARWVFWTDKKKLPDFTGPKLWSVYIRGLDLWWLYPLLCVFDVLLVLNAINRRFTKDKDPLNHFLTLEYAQRKYKTPMSILADHVDNKLKVIEDAEHYFDRVGLPPMYESVVLAMNKRRNT